MTHPNPEKQHLQEEHLATLSGGEREHWAALYRIGNATFRYHQKAKEFKIDQHVWEEWINGLAEPMRSHFKERGFENSKNVLSFTRYVMERNDQGLEQFMRENLSESDFGIYLGQ